MSSTAPTPSKYRIRAYVGTTTAPAASPAWLEGPPRLTLESALAGFITSMQSRHLRGAFAVRVTVVSGPAKRATEHYDLAPMLLQLAAGNERIRSITDIAGREVYVEHAA